MNERILKIAQETDAWCDQRYLGEDSYDIEWEKKFAELIVRECLEELRYTVLDTQELRRDRSTDYQVGWGDGMFDAGETIKNIFGVEE